MANEPAGDDPRVLRTRRDVIDAAVVLLQMQGWERVTHAEVARRSGYAKATVYAHWPTRLDLVRDAVDRLCDTADHPRPTGDLRADLTAGLMDFADDLGSGNLARVLGGMIERSGTDPVIEHMRRRLYAAGSAGLRRMLEPHVTETDVEPIIQLLTGAVFMHVAIQGGQPSAAFIDDVVERALASAHPTDHGRQTVVSSWTSASG